MLFNLQASKFNHSPRDEKGFSLVFLLIYFLRYKIVTIESINIDFVIFIAFFVNLFAFLFLVTFVLTRIYIIYILYSILSNSIKFNLI